MNDVTLASFADELQKIAGFNSVISGALGKPASVTKSLTVGTASKSPVKPTNYTAVHNQSPAANLGTADPVKAVPPPPVRA